MNSSISLGFICFDFTNVINIHKVSKTEGYTIYNLSVNFNSTTLF